MKKQKQEPVNIVNILNNPVDKSKLLGFLDEACRCKLLIKDHNESIKCMKEEALEQIGLDPKMFNSLLKITYDNNAAEKQSEISDLESAIEILFGQQDGHQE